MTENEAIKILLRAFKKELKYLQNLPARSAAQEERIVDLEKAIFVYEKTEVKND